MKVLITLIIGYGISFIILYNFYKKHKVTVSKYVNDALETNFPEWVDYLIGIILFVLLIFSTAKHFFTSLIIWLLLMFVAPFFYNLFTSKKMYSIFQRYALIITSIFTVILLLPSGLHNFRDKIGESFIDKYKVHYTTEIQLTDYDDEVEVQVPHINTGNKTFNFILEHVFPIIYRLIVVLLFGFSLLLNKTLRNENKFFIIEP